MKQLFKILRGFCWKDQDVNMSYAHPFESCWSGERMGKISLPVPPLRNKTC